MALEGFVNAPVPSDPSIPAGALTSDIDAVTLTIPISSVAFLPSSALQFRLRIGNEIIPISGRSSLNLTASSRGAETSTPTAHSSGAAVYVVVTAASLARNPRAMTTAGDIEYLDTNGAPARLAAGTSGYILQSQGPGQPPTWVPASAGGDVVGPSSSVDNALVRYDGTTGKLVQGYSSGAPTISDTGRLAVPTTMYVGANSPSADDSAVLVVRAMIGTINGHAFRDESTLAPTVDAAAYAAFDAQTSSSGSNTFNHMAGFQARMIHNGAGTATDWRGFYVAPNVGSGATITNSKGLYVTNGTGSGAITTQYGIYFEDLTKGGSNYTIYSVGTAPALMSGPMNIGITANTNGANSTDGTFVAHGFGAANKRLMIGYNTTSNYGWLQAGNFASTYSPIMLNVNGTTQSPVCVGTTTTSGGKLIVGGDIATVSGGKIIVNSATLITSTVAFTDGAAAQTGTLTNAPAAGNPTKWIPISDNGTTRYIPAW